MNLRLRSDGPPPNYKCVPKAVYTDDEEMEELKKQIEEMRKRLKLNR